MKNILKKSYSISDVCIKKLYQDYLVWNLILESKPNPNPTLDLILICILSTTFIILTKLIYKFSRRGWYIARISQTEATTFLNSGHHSSWHLRKTLIKVFLDPFSQHGWLDVVNHCLNLFLQLRNHLNRDQSLLI